MIGRQNSGPSWEKQELRKNIDLRGGLSEAKKPEASARGKWNLVERGNKRRHAKKKGHAMGQRGNGVGKGGSTKDTRGGPNKGKKRE